MQTARAYRGAWYVSCPVEIIAATMASLHNKIQTFQLSLPKSDIFLDLDIKHEKQDSLSKINVITLERPTPKLTIEPEKPTLFKQIHDTSSVLLAKTSKFVENFVNILNYRIFPKLSRFQFYCELVVSNLIALLCIPIVACWMLLIFSARRVVAIYLRLKYDDKYELMNGEDAAWGFTKQFHDNCFTSLYIIQGNCSIEKIRNRIKTSLLDRKWSDDGSKGDNVDLKDQYVYKKMRSKIAQKCGFYCWENIGDNFDIDKQIKILDSGSEMDRDGVLKEMQDFMDNPLPKDLPQWVLYIIPRFKHDDGSEEVDAFQNRKRHYVIIWRINHSIMDGLSAINALQTCIADAPVKMSIDTTSPELRPNWKLKALLYFQIAIFGPRLLLKSLLSGNKNNCFQGPELTGPKTVRWSRAICFQSLKQIKNVMSSTMTAVLLSSFGSALRKLAMQKNLPVPGKIFGGATSAVVPYPDCGPQNRFAVAGFPLNVGDECPMQRLKTANDSAMEFGCPAETVKIFNMIRFTGLHPCVVIEKVMNSLQATFLLSNIPGPAERYSMFQGDELVDLMGWNTIKGKTGIGLCMLTYAAKIRIAFVVDGAVLSNPVDIETLIEDFEQELLNLARTCGIRKELVFLDNN